LFGEGGVVVAKVSRNAKTSSTAKTAAAVSGTSKSKPQAAKSVTARRSGRVAKQAPRSGTDKPRITDVRGSEPPIVLDKLSSVDRRTLRVLDDLVADADEITIVGRNDRRLPVAGPVLEALAKVMGALDRGAIVTVMGGGAEDTELTSQQAADLLNVSRPYVVKLARAGVLAHRRIGNRHRFSLADVVDYRDSMRADSEAALAALAPADGYTAADF
jgi:excisionase family DNA binding protein